MDIRRALITDEEAVAECCQNSFKDYIPIIGKEPAPMLIDYGEALKKNPIFVACQHGELMGFVMMIDDEEDYMWLDVLAVDPKYRKKGVGGRLIQYAENFIKRSGKNECRLYTNAKFEYVQEIYARCGYRIYWKGEKDGFDRVYMKKGLRQRCEE